MDQSVECSILTVNSLVNSNQQSKEEGYENQQTRLIICPPNNLLIV